MTEVPTARIVVRVRVKTDVFCSLLGVFPPLLDVNELHESLPRIEES